MAIPIQTNIKVVYYRTDLTYTVIESPGENPTERRVTRWDADRNKAILSSWKAWTQAKDLWKEDAAFKEMRLSIQSDVVQQQGNLYAHSIKSQPISIKLTENDIEQIVGVFKK